MAAFLVALGGAMGTLLRYLSNVWLTQALGTSWPYATFSVNVVGSFCIALLAVLGQGHTLLGVDARLVLGTGVLGGFTTYSSFNGEVLRFAQQGELARAAAYLLTTMITCLAAGTLALWLAPKLLG